MHVYAVGPLHLKSQLRVTQKYLTETLVLNMCWLFLVTVPETMQYNNDLFHVYIAFLGYPNKTR